MSKTTLKTERSLELDKILELLSQQAVSEEAKLRCRELKPDTDLQAVTNMLDQTNAARALIIKIGSAWFGGLTDIRNSLLRAERGGSLSPRELLAVADVYACTESMKGYLAGDETAVLTTFGNCLLPNRHLLEWIRTSIVSDDEIADSASSELADIRRHIRLQSAKVRESLQKLISSPAYSKYLREPIITMRSDRFVVPVKSECKNEIPGLVHDVSSSGNTFFIEPMGAVNANNALRELLIKEKLEIERILAALSVEVSKFRDQLTTNYELLVQLDVIFARAALALSMDGIVPELRSDGIFELIRARHPLLPKATAVPVSISLGKAFDALVVTGPNTGGKTVSLKTAGLLTLMAECGLMIPAGAGSSVNLFSGIYADIGDEQSIEQSLSTFSAHVKTISEILADVDEYSLVLFDELGAGTDPAEGAALAIALIQECLSIGAKVIATTHYAELKMFALRTPRVCNAGCEFDIETLKPTYRLLIGVPGKSNAFAISRKLGIPEHIIDEAYSLLNRKDKDFDNILSQLEEQRSEMERARQDAESLRLETEKLRNRSEESYRELKAEREKLLSGARREAQMILAEARRAANESVDELKKLKHELKQSAGPIAGFNERQANARAALNRAEDKLYAAQTIRVEKKSARAPVAGDTVEILKYGTEATVLSVTKDGKLNLQAGAMKLTLSPEEVYLTAAKKAVQKHPPASTAGNTFRKEAPEMELDLRGMASDEASIVLLRFLDRAVMSKIPSARIIHGKGSGILRKTVQEELRRCRYVKSFRLGVFGEGEDGVTIVEF